LRALLLREGEGREKEGREGNRGEGRGREGREMEGGRKGKGRPTAIPNFLGPERVRILLFLIMFFTR